MAETVEWTGASGKTYKYWVYENTNWKEEAGNYIFAKQTTRGSVALYIGETTNLAERLPNHEALPCARRNGLTHIHAHLNPNGQAARRQEERDLIANYSPACNG